MLPAEHMTRREALSSTEDEIQEKVQRIVAAGRDIALEIPPALADQQKTYESMRNAADADDARRGYVLLAIRQQMQHGQWLAWLRGIGVGVQTAQREIKVAKTLLALENANASRVTHLIKSLPVRRRIKVASLRLETIEELADGGELEELVALPEPDFRQAISTLKAQANKIAKYQERLAARDAEVQSLRQAQAAPATPECLRAAREDAPAIGGAIGAQLDRLAAIGHELLQGAGLAGQRQARREQLAAGAQPLHLTLMSIAAQALAYARAVEHNFEGYLPPIATESPVPLLSAEEVEAVRRKQCELEAAMDIAVRRATAPVPRPKRGRPKGSRTRARR